jgi:hypothetical protein
MSQPAPAQIVGPPVYAYANQRVVRPPLSKVTRKRVWLAGALGNLVLSGGLLIVTLAGVLLLIALILAFVSALAAQSAPTMVDTPFDHVVRAFGLDGGRTWILWTALIVALLVGLAVCAAGVWIGKAILSSGGVDRAWAVATSASGILVGVGLIFSTVASPLTAPLLTIIFSAAVASGGVAPEDQQGILVVLVFSILITVLSVVAYAVAGSLVWWWMAHALRRPGAAA